MIVPTYWAEARVQQRRTRDQEQVTVRRFGWSDDSQDDAERMAKERAQAALDQILAGDAHERHEPRVGYNGAEGVPIREEILSRHGDTILTRNAYGAACLNTPDVLFGDIDLHEGPTHNYAFWVSIALTLIAIALVIVVPNGVVVGVSAVFAVLSGSAIFITRDDAKAAAARRSEESKARARIDAFVKGHPDWHLRIYRTPAGFRLLAMHRTFDALAPEVTEFFTAIGADSVYALMCRNQHCFRARVSPKPWRVGIKGHILPAKSAWPVKRERLPARKKWVARYDKASEGFAACQFIEAIGSKKVDRKAEKVRDLHDRLCHADEKRKMA